MTIDRLRKMCLALPGATEQIQWGADLVFKVGGKMFCVACTEVAPVVTSFKCSDEAFAELCERDGIMPAPYLAGAKWVALERWDAIDDREYPALIQHAYELVTQKLPKKTQAMLSLPGPRAPRAAGRSTAATRRAARPRKA